MADKMTASEAINELPAVFARIVANETFGQKVSEVQHDREVIKKVLEVLAAGKKKMDQDLKTQRQVKGEDYLSQIPLWRKPRQGKEESDPLAEFAS